MSQPEINEIVDTFLTGVKQDERPYRRLADVLMVLQSKGWPTEVLSSIQTIVCGELANRRGIGPTASSYC